MDNDQSKKDAVKSSNGNVLYLYIGFGILLFSLAAVALHSYKQFSIISQTFSNEMNGHHRQSSAATHMRVAVRERAILLLQMSHFDDPFLRDEYYLRFDALGTQYQKARLEMLDTRLLDREKRLLSMLDKETSVLAPELRRLAELLSESISHEKSIALLNQTLDGQAAVSNILDQLVEIQIKHYEAARLENTGKTRRQLTQFIVWMGFIIVVGAVFSRIVVKRAIGQNKQLVLANQELERLSGHDHLTGLQNRKSLMEHLELNFEVAKRHNQKGALLYIDLDGFKSINDNYGHHAGDEFLRIISQEMKAFLRESDVLARIGGDEFIVVLLSVDSDEEVQVVARKLLRKLSAEYDIGAATVSASASIGIGFFPAEGMSVDSLIKIADEAMYQAKESGKNRFYVGNQA
ncbi:MAG: GGDEF domain-containing protein [Gammaproteobacteria bacterium]|nr:GGDEF domain-containing protein [Gammaproteobacteria bacterium]